VSVGFDRVGAVSDRLVEAGLRLAVAESCTGGMLAAALTDRSGASRFLEAGVVVYSNEAKERLLGVRPDTLAAYGAVSDRVAGEMAEGARRSLGVDVAVSITGIAGPDGGTAEKPVGTVWIALSDGERVRAHHYRFDGDRAAVRRRSVEAALELLNLYLADRS